MFGICSDTVQVQHRFARRGQSFAPPRPAKLDLIRLGGVEVYQ